MHDARWGDKTPLNSFCLDEIYETFPRAKYIFVQRALYDVVYSYLRMGRYRKAEAAAERWISANHSCIKFRERNKDNVITVRYEDLTAQPNKIFASIFNFADLEFREEFLDKSVADIRMGDHNVEHYRNVKKNISSSNVGKGKARLSKGDFEEIGKVIMRSNIPLELQELI